MTENNGPCDVDDILCQAGILRNLKELKTGMGEERFTKHFPEFDGLPDKLESEITYQIALLRDAVGGCDSIDEEIVPELEEAESVSEE